MAALTPFRQSGKTRTFAVQAGPAATAYQVVSDDAVGNQQYVLTNTGSKTAFIGMGTTQGNALSAAVIPVQDTPGTLVYVMLSGSQVTITGPLNAWFAGLCAGTDTSVIWVTPGYGQ